MTKIDYFGAKERLNLQKDSVTIFQIDRIEKEGLGKISEMPYSIRVILEAVLRHCDGEIIKTTDVENLANWDPENFKQVEIPYRPARVLLQDFTGVPAVVDLAALRSAMQRLGGDPKKINPLVPVDLVIDHSVQVDQFGTKFALLHNAEREFERNRERYEFLRWGQKGFRQFQGCSAINRDCPPGKPGISGKGCSNQTKSGEMVAFPDTLVGTNSHTTMINGLGVVGWGVGGIEAEATMLGQPIYMLTPEVVGFKLIGELPEGTTATDFVLTATQILRSKGVVGKFVEYYGPGVSRLSLADRATLANMAPEYGATMGFFPVDNVTLAYLKNTGRNSGLVDLVERYTKQQHLFLDQNAPEPKYNDYLELDMSTVEPSLAGPKRPQDRIPLKTMKHSFQVSLTETFLKDIPTNKGKTLTEGAVVIAAITSCTNTSNPSVMVAAGLLAKNAVSKGLRVPDYVKTSLAPGSKVVTALSG